MRAEKPLDLEMTQSYRKSFTDWNTYITLSLKANIKKAKVKKVTGQKRTTIAQQWFYYICFFIFFFALAIFIIQKKKKQTATICLRLARERKEELI